MYCFPDKGLLYTNLGFISNVLISGQDMCLSVVSNALCP